MLICAARQDNQSYSAGFIDAGLKDIMNVLASDFSGMAPLVIVVPVLFALVVASFVPSARGHWSGPVLAAPWALGTLALIVAQSSQSLDAFAWGMLLSPLAVSAGSVALWAVRRGAR